MTVTIAGAPVLGYLLASVRIVAWLWVAPPFNNTAIPSMAKVVLALALSFAVSPLIAQQSVPTSFGELIIVVLTQVMIGAAMGFATLLLFSAVSAAGSFIDLFGNFQLAAAYDPLMLNQNSVFGRLYELMAVTLLMVTDGHLIVIGGLLNTFRYLPLGGSVDVSGWGTIYTTAMGMFFSIGLEIALPLVAVLFITDLALALISRVAPAMNPMSVMQAAKIGLTLLLAGVAFPVVPHAVDNVVDLITQAIGSLGGAP